MPLENGSVQQRDGVVLRGIARHVYEETVVAYRQARPERGVPQVAGIDFVVRSIRRSGVGLAGQQIGIVRGEGIGGYASGKSRNRHIHAAIRALRIQAQAAVCVGDRVLALHHVGSLRRGGPQPAVIADFGRVQEVVERNEGSRQIVLSSA